MLTIKLINDGKLIKHFYPVDLILAIQDHLRKNKTELIVKNVYKDANEVAEIVNRMFYRVKTTIKDQLIQCEFDNEYKHL
jgi:hypothetical protein